MNALTEAMFLANEAAYTAVRPMSRSVVPYNIRRASHHAASFMLCFSNTIVGAEDAWA